MPKIVDREQYRSELLEKCFTLFAEKGYGSLTMRQIATELGVSTGTLYHYFPSKEVLFEQLIEEIDRKINSEVILALENYVTVQERIEFGFNYFAQNEGYFIKQTLILIEFYQRHGQEKASKNQVLKQIWARQRQEIAKHLNIQDENMLDMVWCLLDGLLLNHFFGLIPVTYTAQAKLLTQILTTYQQNQLSQEDA